MSNNRYCRDYTPEMITELKANEVAILGAAALLKMKSEKVY